MKTITWAALLTFLITAPFVLKKKRLQAIGLNLTDDTHSLWDENLRYAIDDFLT